MLAHRLPSVAYEPPGQPSLFDRWEAGEHTALPPPLAVCDARYRAMIARVLGRHRAGGRRLVSIGAGNGTVEAELAAEGWDVLATDPAASALRICRAKGLTAKPFELMADALDGRFDVIYCDGVMGHLWHAESAAVPAWIALARLGRRDSLCLVSNDLSDDDKTASFTVRASTSASFYRPPPSWFGRDARATGLWSVESERTYDYTRSGVARRREIVVARLLVHERVEPKDGA